MEISSAFIIRLPFKGPTRFILSKNKCGYTYYHIIKHKFLEGFYLFNNDVVYTGIAQGKSLGSTRGIRFKRPDQILDEIGENMVILHCAILPVCLQQLCIDWIYF